MPLGGPKVKSGKDVHTTQDVRLNMRLTFEARACCTTSSIACAAKGRGTLAVPTGIVGAEFAALKTPREPTTRSCHECLSEGHSPDARFCRDCGAELPPWQHDAARGA